jgi:hypothetical protein
MIDPTTITRYDRTEPELEEFLLFCIMVAGKRADTTSRCLDMFLAWITPDDSYTPFQAIRRFRRNTDTSNRGALAALGGALIAFNQLHPGCGIGQMRRMARAFLEAASSINVQQCTLKDLQKIHGIGPKTARLFILHSRSDHRLAVLDTHVLKHLRSVAEDRGWDGVWVPNATPSNPRDYADLEKIVLELADEQGMTPAEFDLHIWLKYAKGATHANHPES